MKRDSVSADVPMRRYIPFPLYAPVHISDYTPPPPLTSSTSSISTVVYVLNRWPISQPPPPLPPKKKKNHRIWYSMKYKH